MRANQIKKGILALGDLKTAVAAFLIFLVINPSRFGLAKILRRTMSWTVRTGSIRS